MNAEKSGWKINNSPFEAPGSVTLLKMMTNNRTRSIDAMVDHADVDDRVLTDRLRQKRKGKRALLLFEVDAFDLVAVLRDQARLARQNVRDIIADARDLV